MRLLVVTPTCRWGGLDVAAGSLLRQELDDDATKVTWLVVDKMYNERREVFEQIHALLRHRVEVIHAPEVPSKGEYRRRLAWAYNRAVSHAVKGKYDVLVSMQDFLWAPPDGLQRFVEAHLERPRSLVTGLCSHSYEPGVQAIFDWKGKYTLFREPYYAKPSPIEWLDVRLTDLYQGVVGVSQCSALHWEANWASVDVSLLREGLKWDESFDKGVAYENMDLACSAVQHLGATCLIDIENHSISLPHKVYWPADEAETEAHSNRERFERKWG